jgi:hypothetical protein
MSQPMTRYAPEAVHSYPLAYGLSILSTLKRERPKHPEPSSGSALER